MDIREYLKKNKLLSDGGFGTYYATLVNDNSIPEKANILNPDLVKKIHMEYINSGAKIIRTNTFASNRDYLSCNESELIENIKAAYKIAKEAVKESKKEVYIAADVGPITNSETLSEEELYKEYMLICNTFINEGADILLFETFQSFNIIKKVIKEISKNDNIFIITQFCINAYGYTNKGVSAKKLLEEAKEIDEIDAVGFNCGIGPAHFYNVLKNLNLKIGKFITALPNASYPSSYNARMVFTGNVEYFANKMSDIAKLGVDIIGGCCGTNPDYIKAINNKVNLKGNNKNYIFKEDTFNAVNDKKENAFYFGKDKNKKLIAVELSPPIDSNCEKLMDAANLLKNIDVDVITFPDSPSGRTRADSILMGVKVFNEVKIPVMPHICCRDKNSIAIRSQLLGAHINEVKNFLVITGDPVPTMLRQNIKPVFNFDSVGAMKIIREMNEDKLKNDPIIYGGALNYNRRNIDVEINRMKKKIEAGASFFMTQPVFTKEDAEKLRYIKSKVDARILCGIMPLVSRRNALFMQNEMTGINVTDEIVNMYKENMTREESEKVAVNLAKSVISYTSDFVDGYYFSIPFNRVYLLKDIL